MSGDDEKGAPGPSLPVNWSLGGQEAYENPGTGNGTQPVGVQTKAIVTPSAREAALFSDQRIKTCASCKYFDHERTQREFKRTGGAWFKQLVHDMGWKVRHLGAHPKHLAVCGQRDDTLVSPQSRACEYHKPK